MATNKNSNRPYKGLFTDSSSVDQPKGTYTMAWNAINETREGDSNFISNEESNAILINTLPSGYILIGSVYIGNNDTALFSTNGTNSEIGIMNEKGTYTTVVNDNASPCLNFNVQNQIEAVFRVRRGCERVIYFTDGLNPVRYFNFDEVDDFRIGGASGANFDCELFKLFLEFTPPCFPRFELSENGSLESGAYCFAIQYLDNDLNPTKWSYISQTIPIFKSILTTTYRDIKGSSNLATDSIGGSGPTTKGIKVFLSDLDPDFIFYRFAVIHFTSNSGLPTIAYQSGIKSVTNAEFFYGGPSDEYVQIDISEITISGDYIGSAKHIEQLENRLVLANTKGKQLDFCSFQIKASLIKANYVVKAVGPEELISGNPKSPNTYWHNRGYMGDEVYAFGIVYVFKDGYESPVYHIPGRDLKNYDCLASCSTGAVTTTNLELAIKPIMGIQYTGGVQYNTPCMCVNLQTIVTIVYTLNTGSGPVTQPTSVTTLACGNQIGWLQIATAQSTPGGTVPVLALSSISVQNNGCTANITTTDYRIQVISNTLHCPSDPVTPWEENIAHIYPQSEEADYNLLSDGAKLKKWQIYNTAQPINAVEGSMAYWEAENAIYPTILDCSGGNYWGVDFCGNTLRGSKIRHHKFPDRNLVPHVIGNVNKTPYNSVLTIKLNFAATNPANTEAELDSVFGSSTTIKTITVAWSFDPDGTGAVAQTALSFDFTRGDFTYVGADSIMLEYSFVAIDETAEVAYGASAPGGISGLTIAGTLTTTTSTSGFSFAATNALEGPTAEEPSNKNLDNQILGIKFDNIIYPHADIIGHYIVRGDRDEFNRTVIAKGISNPLHESTTNNINYSLFSYLRGGPDNGGHSNSTPNIINRSNSSNWFISPDLLFNRTGNIGRYIKKENEFKFTTKYVRGNQGSNPEFDHLTEFGAVNDSAIFGDGTAYICAARRLNYSAHPTTVPAVQLRPIDEALIMMPMAKSLSFISDRFLFNLSQFNPVQILNLDILGLSGGAGTTIKPASVASNICYTSIKLDRDVHPDPLSITYIRTHNCMYTNSGTINEIYGGDTFINLLNMPNSIVWGFNNSPWDLVASIVGLIASVVLTVVTYGAAAPITIAVAIAATAGTVAAIVNECYDQYRSGMEWVTRQDSNIITGNISAVHRYDTYTTKNAVFLANEFASGIYVESTINIGLRQDDIRYKGGNEFFKDLRGGDSKELLEHCRDRYFFYNGADKPLKEQWSFRGLAVFATYIYNRDYSVFNKLNVYFPLPESYNCCSGCLETFPTRVSYSQQSFQEEAADNYRVFLANNYRDLEAEKGEITNLIRSKNNLLIHTEESLYNLPQNIQERVTGDLISFIGTGEYFNIPPRLMVDDDIGTAGSIDKWATIKTPNGIFFVDRNTGQIFLTTAKGIQPLIIGMRNFLKENLKLIFAQQYYDLIGSEFPNTQNPANPNGIGIHAVYDYRHKRIILTKRDYQIISGTIAANFRFTDKASGAASDLVDGGLVYSSYTGKFGLATSTSAYGELSNGFHNQDYFENKSWTLSYSFLSNTWVSFHSYIPLYMYPIHNNFVSISSTNFTTFTDTHKLWKHNVVGNYQKFYGTRYKHILEYISLSSPIETTLFDEIILQTIAKKYSGANQEFIDERFVTFNKAILHNSRQTTGQLTLTPKNQDTVDYLSNQVKNTVNSEIIIDRSERDWKINELRDYRIDYTKSIFTKDWTNLKVEFPIDKVINSTSISFTKDWFDLQPLRDKYLIIRFIFDNLDDVKLTTNYTFEIENKSFR